MRLLITFAAALSLLACSDDSSTSTKTGGDPGGAATFKVGDLAMIPAVGGVHEPAKSITRADQTVIVPQTTVNFYGTSQDANLRYKGSILIYRIGASDFPLDTSYSTQRPSANLSFFRNNAGQDSCYYSSMSGTLHVSAWKETTLNGKPGHLITGELEANMAFPWAPKNRKTCPETLSTTLSFTEAFIATID